MTSISLRERLLIIIIFSVIVFFSLFHITESPLFGTDEGWAIQVASNISKTGIDGLQFSPGNIQHVSVLTSVGYPLLYSLAFWFKLLGSGILQGRIMMTFYMFGLAVASFVLLRRLYGNIIALSSLAILVSFPPFYTFGKEVIGEVPLLFFLVVFLLCFNMATSDLKRKNFYLFVAGIAAGLCIVTKTMALAFIPVLFVGAFLALKRGTVSFKNICTVVIGSIIPILVWIIVNFQPGDSIALTFDYYSNPSALTDRAATFWLNLGMFVSGIGPLFMLSLIIVWIAGIAIRWKAKAKIGIEESVALIFSLVLMLSFLFRYWDARYLFPVQVLGILFAPYSFYYLLSVLQIKRIISKKNMIFISGVICLSLLGLYQLSFHSFIADSYKSTYTRDLSRYFSSIPDSTSIFFYNTTNVVPFFHGRNYYQRITMFKKWVLGSEYIPIARDASVDMLVLGPPMLEKDQELPLLKYEEVAEFKEIRIFKKKTQ